MKPIIKRKQSGFITFDAIAYNRAKLKRWIDVVMAFIKAVSRPECGAYKFERVSRVYRSMK